MFWTLEIPFKTGFTLFTLTANGFLPGGIGTTIRHDKQHTSHKITHNPQTKHITQNYTNNKGHTTHNEYNANTITTTINKKYAYYTLNSALTFHHDLPFTPLHYTYVQFTSSASHEIRLFVWKPQSHYCLRKSSH
jgi:hypothetical protein